MQRLNDNRNLCVGVKFMHNGKELPADVEVWLYGEDSDGHYNLHETFTYVSCAPGL